MAEQKKKRNSEPSKTEKKPFSIEFEDIPKLTPDQIKDLCTHQVELETQVVELRNTEEELQERERVLALQPAILKSVRDPLWATDSGFRIVYRNDAAAATFGWTAFKNSGPADQD